MDVYKGEIVLGISKHNPLSQKKKISEDDLIGQDLLYYSGESSEYMKDTFLATLSNDFTKYHVRKVLSIEKWWLIVR